MQKRIAAIHDISCVGRCSLTVALPLLSAAGIETCAIPTAVLSTHTGGFSGYTFRDLTEDLVPIAAHWQTLNLKFDALYTGFLGSEKQIKVMLEIINMLANEETLLFVDPVMADHGELYPCFSEDFPAKMLKLCSKAKIVVPNMTEAALLLGIPFKKGPYTPNYVRMLLEGLCSLGPDTAVVTGVFYDEEHYGAAALSSTGEVINAFTKRITGIYYGTGDIFASVLLCAIINGICLNHALKLAVDFTTECAMRTFVAGTDTRFGVNFEEGIPKLINDLKQLMH